VSLKNALERSHGISPAIRWGRPGQLDVLVDGQLVFSKKSAGRSPTSDEIARLIRGR
jgi:hypothetical protein